MGETTSSRHGDLIFCSGTVPVVDGVIVSGGVRGQTLQTLRNLQKVVEEAGGSLETILKCTRLLREQVLYARAGQKPWLECGLAFSSMGLGLDLSKLDLDRPIVEQLKENPPAKGLSIIPQYLKANPEVTPREMGEKEGVKITMPRQRRATLCCGLVWRSQWRHTVAPPTRRNRAFTFLNPPVDEPGRSSY